MRPIVPPLERLVTIRRIGCAALVSAVMLSVTACVSLERGTGAAKACWQQGRQGTGWIRSGRPVPVNSADPWREPDSVGVSGYFSPESASELVLDRAYPGYQLSAGNQVISPPGGYPGFGGAALAGDDWTILAFTRQLPRTYLRTGGCPARFYEVRLSAAGRPGPLIPLDLGLPRWVAPVSVALTPDGGLAAVLVGFGHRWRIVVFSTVTGRTRVWAWHGPQPQYLGWSGDHAIDFVVTNLTGRGPAWQQLNVSSLYRLSVRVQAPRSKVDPFKVLVTRLTPPGSLARYSPWRIDDLTISANGRTAFAAIGALTDHRQTLVQAVLRLSAVTGKLSAVVIRPAVSSAVGNNGPPFCDVLWTDGSGSHLLAACGQTAGWINNGKFTEEARARRLVPGDYFNSPVVW
jgi:hypothetical protein